MTKDDPAFSDPLRCLGPDDGGRWRILTEHSPYVWDLDAMTMSRLPMTSPYQSNRDDRELHILEVVVWPEIGRRFVLWYFNPARPDIVSQRSSTDVVAIHGLRQDLVP